jgi:hypothetical protein
MWLEGTGLSLSKIRNLKLEALAMCQRIHLDISNVALACVYFEKLVLTNVLYIYTYPRLIFYWLIVRFQIESKALYVRVFNFSRQIQRTSGTDTLNNMYILHSWITYPL